MTTWSLWQKQNTQLWDNKIETIMQVTGRANYTLQAWQQARTTAATTVFTQENKVAMGACHRDEAGDFVAAFSCHDNGIFTAPEVEAWGLFKGLEWIALMGFNKLFLLGDKQTVALMLLHDSLIPRFSHYF
ncbi:putative ribonuclease H protein [Trifolium medium]|uniref:Putative ribonuclease H protein n=1 Tax=Trifolium medium TaxID=97028 RepID=A0A392M423_9FABA|nr:putative ribonuclease H protein [Trifolium medium]